MKVTRQLSSSLV